MMMIMKYIFISYLIRGLSTITRRAKRVMSAEVLDNPR